MSEAQSGIARNGARTIQDLRDAIRGHADLSRQFSRAHIECFQFFGQVFTRMDSSDCHGEPPSDSQQSQRLMAPATGPATRSKSAIDRSEERRVGKECRSRWAQDHYKTINMS